jgi:hypothetical protein
MVRAPSRIDPDGRLSTFFTGAVLLVASDAGGSGGSLFPQPFAPKLATTTSATLMALRI